VAGRFSFQQKSRNSRKIVFFLSLETLLNIKTNKMAKVIVLDCRNDLKNFFDNGLKYEIDSTCKHYPFLVYETKGAEVHIHIIGKARDVINKFGSKKNTKVMKQWPGQWKSDFIEFTVGELSDLVKQYESNKDENE
jgi:hypothetical protein